MYGILFVKDCPPVTVADEPFHSNIPYLEFPVSNQYVPAAGFAAGALAVATSSVVFTSALVMYALLATPKYEYAACNPYSLSSPP